MNLRERWEARRPMAKVAFFGAQGPEEDAVYDWAFTGPGDALTMAVDRRGHLARVLVPMSHVVYLLDPNPRRAGSGLVDVRVYMDGGFALKAVVNTMRHVSSRVLGMLVDDQGQRVRALVSESTIQEVVPLLDDGDDVNLLVIRDEYSCELWPELGHKR